MLYRDKQLHEKETELLNYHTLILQEQAIAKNIFSELLHSEVIHLPGLYFSLSPMSVYNGDVLLAEKVNNTLYIMLGDFTGHGLPAAIGSIPTSEIFYAMVRKQKSIANIAAEINSKLKKLLPSSMFCAACIISYETQKHELSIWQGGLPTGYLMHEDGEKITELNSIHLPLGILSAGDFESDIQQFQLEKTSKLVFMTDGYIEMKNAEGKVLAKEAIIKEIINKKTNQQISALQNLLQQHMKSEQLLDDVAIMSMELCV